MKVLFIGGTGNISSAVSRLAIHKGIDLYHLNRGVTKKKIDGVKTITGDINRSSSVKKELQKHQWDCVVNWIAFTPEDVERDLNIFEGHTRQYIFISSASCYQTPLLHPVVTESTPVYNPIWEYSNNKIKCEDLLTHKYHETGFPMTIVRPSLTYETVIPIAIGGFKEFTTANRILKRQPIIIHGDGKSLWTVTHSEDFAKGFVGLIGNLQATGHAFHITSDEILSWNVIYDILGDALGEKVNAIHISSQFICSIEPSFTGTLLTDKAESVIFDNSKIKQFVPEFKATIPFREGVRRTLQWLDENPDQKIISDETNTKIERIIAAYVKGSGR